MSNYPEETCAKFNQLAWHDSKLISVRIYPSEDLLTHNLDFGLKLLTNTKPGEYEVEEATLTAKDCRAELTGARHVILPFCFTFR